MGVYPDRISARREGPQPDTPHGTPQAVLDTLHHLATKGNLKGVIDQAEQLAELDPKQLPTVHQLQTLARTFQEQALLRLIQQLQHQFKLKLPPALSQSLLQASDLAVMPQNGLTSSTWPRGTWMPRKLQP